MQKAARIVALVVLLVVAGSLLPGGQPACEGSSCYQYYSYMEGQCLVTEIWNTCFGCVDYQWECPWGDWEDITCY